MSCVDQASSILFDWPALWAGAGNSTFLLTGSITAETVHKHRALGSEAVEAI